MKPGAAGFGPFFPFTRVPFGYLFLTHSQKKRRRRNDELQPRRTTIFQYAWASLSMPAGIANPSRALCPSGSPPWIGPPRPKCIPTGPTISPGVWHIQVDMPVDERLNSSERCPVHQVSPVNLGILSQPDTKTCPHSTTPSRFWRCRTMEPTTQTMEHVPACPPRQLPTPVTLI